MKKSKHQELARNIGRQVHALRRQNGLTQEELAERADLSPSHISRIETGKKLPGTNALSKIANSLGATVDALLGSTSSFDLNANYTDMNSLLNSCTLRERKILCDIAVASLASIRENT